MIHLFFLLKKENSHYSINRIRLFLIYKLKNRITNILIILFFNNTFSNENLGKKCTLSIISNISEIYNNNN